GHAVSAERGIRVHVRANARPPLTPPEEEDLFYIRTEALTNVQKHARATDAELTLTSTRRVLRLEVADNGRGFMTRKSSSGFGVQGLRERAAALGGQLRVVSAAGRGTRVLFSRTQ